jgi:hypothetical protein
MARRSTKMLVHARVVAIAAVLGLAAYAVVRVLIVLSDRLGLLDWIRH